MQQQISQAIHRVSAAMEQRGHNRSDVIDYLWVLFIQSPEKLSAHLSIEPEHFEQGFKYWQEQRNEEWYNFRHMIESL